MGDARLELEDALSGVAENAGRDEAGTPTQGEHRARVQSRVAGAVALILGGLGVFLAWRDLTRRPDARPVARLGVDVPRGLALRDARPAVSPDGRHLALAVRGVDSRLWVRSLETGETQPLAGTEGARGPFRSPDGADIGFLCLETSGVIVLKRVGFPAGGVQTICSVPGTNSSSAAWSGEGRILFAAGDNGGVRIHSVPSAGGDPRVVLEPDATAGELILKVPHSLDDPHVSPDGRWLAYCANDTGGWEVYLMPYGREGERIPVSLGGGRQPRWRGDSRELFYVTPQGELMAVPVRETEDGLEQGRGSRLFNAGVRSRTRSQYGVTRDGQRFLVITPVEGDRRSLEVVLNWTALLE